jgi:hypothetical protein
MSSRLILRWEIDGKLQRDSRMWIPRGDRGVRLYDLAHRLLGTLHGITDVKFVELDALQEDTR